MNTVVIRQAIITCILLTGFCISHAQKKSESKSSDTSGESIMYINRESDEDGEGETRIKFKKGDEVYFIRMVGDKVTELTIDGKSVPADSMHLYTKLIDSVKEQLKKDMAQAQEDRKQAALDRVQAQKDRAQAIKDREQAIKDREKAVQDRAQAQKDREQMILHRIQAEKDRVQAQKDREQAIQDRAQFERDRAQAVKDRAQAEIDRKRAAEDRALIKNLLETAVKDGLITDADEVTKLELSSEGFWINDKKQSDTVHSKYQAAFLKKIGSKYTFSRNYSGSRQTVTDLQ